jgi:hypothetical protein
MDKTHVNGGTLTWSVTCTTPKITVHQEWIVQYHGETQTRRSIKAPIWKCASLGRRSLHRSASSRTYRGALFCSPIAGFFASGVS